MVEKNTTNAAVSLLVSEDSTAQIKCRHLSLTHATDFGTSKVSAMLLKSLLSFQFSLTHFLGISMQLAKCSANSSLK